MADNLRTTSYAEAIPLSFAQMRLWFTYQLEGPSAAYNMPFALRLEGRLDKAALAHSLDDLVARHETLRTVVVDSADGAAQYVIDAACVELALTEVQVGEAGLAAAMEQATAYCFDLERHVPIRVWLFELRPDCRVLLLLMHHIACDGWSLAPLTKDLSTAYAARSAGAVPDWEPMPVQYADYSLWQREVLGDEEDPQSLAAQQGAYWRQALAGLPEQLNLATDRPRPATAATRCTSR